MATAAHPVEARAAPAGAPDSAEMDCNGMIKKPALWFKTLPAFANLRDGLFHNKFMRQMGRGQEDDEGNDVGGYFVVSDAGAAMLFETSQEASAWANSKYFVNVVFAPSLTYVDINNVKLAVVNEDDLVKLVLRYPKMKPLGGEAALSRTNSRTHTHTCTYTNVLTLNH